MAGIPLPALDIRPPQAPPNQLDQLGQILGLRNAIQEAPLRQQALQNQVQSGGLQVQQQQQQLKDQQGIAAWYKSIDPNDPNALNPATVGRALANNGVSGSGILNVQGQILKHRQTAATLTKDQLANQQELSNNLYNGINSVIGETDPQKRAQALTPLITQASSNGIIPPQQAQQMLANPAAITDDQLKTFQHSLGVSAAFLRGTADSQRATIAQTTFNSEHGPLSTAQIQQYNDALTATWGAQHPNAPLPKSLQLGPGATADDLTRMSKLMPKAAAPTMLSLWMAQHPGKTVDDYMAVQNSMKPEFPRVVPVNDAKGDVVGYNLFSGTGGGVKTQYISASQIGGMPQNLGGTPGVIPPKPTSTVLTQSQRSEMLEPQVASLGTQIDGLASQLGPMAGRWNDLMTGKVGTNNPAFASLKTQLKLFATALTQAHGLHGEGYVNAMEKDFTAAQSPADLKARIAGANDYLNSYIQMSGHGPGANPAQPNAGGGGNNFFSKFGGVAH